MTNDQTLANSPERADGNADAAAPGQSFKFMEPLGKNLLWVLALAALMVLFYGLTFGVQGIAEHFHSPALQAFADSLFNGGMMTNAVWQGEIWRPVTVAFLHGGMFHLFGNVVNFCLLAYFCNIAFARKGWIVTFFASSILGAVATILVNPSMQLVGASIGIMGLYGSLIAAELRKRKMDKTLLPATSLIPLKSLVLLLIMQLVLEHLIPNVGHTAHIAGLLIGFVLGLVLPLNAGVRLYSSREGMVKITSLKRRKEIGKNKSGLSVVQNLTYTVGELQAGDYLWAEQTEIGIARLTKTSQQVLLGEVAPGQSLPKTGYLVASRFAVPSVDSLVVSEETSENVVTAPVSLWRRAFSLALLGYIWLRLFQSWAPDITMPKADLQWLHFLPNFLAEPAINIASVLGALIVTYFAASMLSSMIGGMLLSFLSGFFSGAKDKQDSDKSA
ncbi:hypothetical protein BH11CYA1_BH11CYA1_08190 [soil metagenome]